jgi:DNA-binding IclR family transcriptional regulator
MTAPYSKCPRVQAALYLISLIAKAPRTRPELIELTGMDKGIVGVWVKGMLEEGLIEPCGARRRPGSRLTTLYRWIPRPQEVPGAAD